MWEIKSWSCFLPSHGVGFLGFRNKMEQPQGGEKNSLWNSGIPNFPSNRLFPTQYPGKTSPRAHFEFFLFFFFLNPKQASPINTRLFIRIPGLFPKESMLDVPKKSFFPGKLFLRIQIKIGFPPMLEVMLEWALCALFLILGGIPKFPGAVPGLK